MGLCLAAGPIALRADTVVLTGGDRLSGQVQRLRGGRLEVATPWGGTLLVDAARLQSVETDGEVTVILRDYSRHTGRLVAGDPGRLHVRDQAGAVHAVEPSRVSALLPGRLSADQWRVTGHLSAGLSSSAGNTDLSRTSFDGEAIARRGKDRWSLAARGAQAREGGDATEGNVTLDLQFDRFISEGWYALAATTLENDARKDLRLRATAGAGLGHSLMDTRRTQWLVEGTLERVRADYSGAADTANSALSLSLRLDHALWDDRAQLFHRSQSFLGLGESGRSFARSQTGLRLPIAGGLQASLQLNLDWDGAPAPGRRSVDRTVLLSLGLRW